MLKIKESISASLSKSERIRDITREFYIDSFNVFDKAKGKQNCPFISTGLSRFYHSKVNSLSSLEHDDIDYFLKLGEQNPRCIRCGQDKDINLESRREENLSNDRKHCRYLRSYCIEYCQDCSSTRVFKSKSRRQAIGQNRIKEDVIKKKKTSDVIVSKPIKPITNPPKKKINQPQPSKRLLGPTRITKDLSSKIKKNNQDNSGLRAFSCLLKK